MNQETGQWHTLLEYKRTTTPSDKVPGDVGCVHQKWSSDQIGDFVRKLGFLDKDKEESGGHNTTAFIYFNQVYFVHSLP